MALRPSTETLDLSGEALLVDQLGVREVYRTGQSIQTSSHGATNSILQLEDLVTLSGATTNSNVSIPANAMVLAVSAYVVTAITGTTTTAWKYGVSGTDDKFGSGVALAKGTATAGAIGPTCYYTATPIVLTPTGTGTPSFTAGQVRLVIQYIQFTAPTS